jgi:hypothetical protein
MYEELQLCTGYTKKELSVVAVKANCEYGGKHESNAFGVVSHACLEAISRTGPICGSLVSCNRNKGLKHYGHKVVS